MKKVCFFYDLLFVGGIESSLNDLLYSMSNYKNIFSLAHIHQYFTQQEVLNNISKNVREVIDLGTCNELNTDIFISSTIIFPYNEVLRKVKAKHKIGWLHTIPNKQVMFENIFLYKEYYKQFDYWICVSEEVKKGLKSILPNAKCEVIHNTINEERIKKLAKEKVKMKKADLTLVTSSRIGKEKGFEYAIQVIDKIHKAKINYVWYILGIGVDSDTIELIEEASKKYNIELVGYEKNPYKYIARADYGLMMSPLESWSIFYDECHILGTPTITFDLPVYHERQNPEKMGMLIKEKNIEFNLELLLFKKREYKSYLKNYKYKNDYEKWVNLLNRFVKM